MVAMFGAASRETIYALYIFALVPPRWVEKKEPCFDKAQRVWVQGQAEEPAFTFTFVPLRRS